MSSLLPLLDPALSRELELAAQTIVTRRWSAEGRRIPDSLQVVSARALNLFCARIEELRKANY